jgi:hypothetical protein
VKKLYVDEARRPGRLVFPRHAALSREIPCSGAELAAAFPDAEIASAVATWRELGSQITRRGRRACDNARSTCRAVRAACAP